MFFWKKKKTNETIEKNEKSEKKLIVNKSEMLDDLTNDIILDNFLELTNFLKDKGFFVKKKIHDDIHKEPTKNWAIGPLGRLVRYNVLRWWLSEITGKLSNIIVLNEINNDKNLFYKYKAYAKMNNLNLPFGISRVKKAPRELFKSREFVFTSDDSRQLFLDFFIHPSTSNSWLKTWNEFIFDNIKKIGLSEKNISVKFETQSFTGNFFHERHRYQFKFPFGNENILTISNRIDFDFESIVDPKMSADLKLLDSQTNKQYHPHIIEVKVDVEKLVLALILDKYTNIYFNGNQNVSTLFTPFISPIKCAILPEELTDSTISAGQEIETILSEKYKVVFEQTGTLEERIKHFREFGVPFFITFDSKNVEDNAFKIFDVANDKWIKLKKKNICNFLKDKITIS